MSLATRCTACGTMFRVVQDQLKVSEGWVRCGRCQEVFNALEEVVDLDRDATVELRTPGPTIDAGPAAADDAAPAMAAPASAPLPIEPTVPVADDRPGLDTATAGPSTLDSGSASDHGDFLDARFKTSVLASQGFADAALPSAAPASPPSADAAVAADGDAAAPAPSFLTAAERAARWRRPGVRIATTLLALMLLGGLALQVSLQFHDAMAARWPALQPPLAALCEAAGCRLEPPRQLDALSVDSSGLTRAADGGDAYRLSVVLRNRADFMVALPAVELSLTDSNGQLIARRVFAPAEFRSAAPALPPLAETPLQLQLATAERVSGYTIEIFYP